MGLGFFLVGSKIQYSYPIGWMIIAISTQLKMPEGPYR